jgi:hypothetical protein
MRNAAAFVLLALAVEEIARDEIADLGLDLHLAALQCSFFFSAPA